MLMKKLKSHNFSYNTYFIAGTENIQPFLMQGKETKEETLIRIVKSFAQNGLDVFQLRCKKMQESETYKLIYEISRVLENTKCKLCLNDNPKLASQTKDVVDILHIGQHDMLAEKARDIIGDQMKLGLSITDISQLEKVSTCVDYLGVGPIYSTPSKEDASAPIGEEELHSIILRSSLPVVAIGGISIENTKRLFNLGVSGVAVISALLKEKNNLDLFKKFKKVAKQ